MVKLIGMNGLPVSIAGTTPDGDGYINIVSFVTADGVPKVVVIARLDTPSSYEATLDGHPAVAFFLGEEQNGTGNAPWELGHMLAEKWDEAQKLAASHKGSKIG
jgi:hypothetical protein